MLMLFNFLEITIQKQIIFEKKTKQKKTCIFEMRIQNQGYINYSSESDYNDEDKPACLCNSRSR